MPVTTSHTTPILSAASSCVVSPPRPSTRHTNPATMERRPLRRHRRSPRARRTTQAAVVPACAWSPAPGPAGAIAPERRDTTMADTIRTGIVGATVTQGGSGWGANAHVPALHLLPDYTLQAVCTAPERHPGRGPGDGDLRQGARPQDHGWPASAQRPDADVRP